jgi:hypothetical protein
MIFTALVVFILVLALRGAEPNRKTYIAIAVAALVASVWEYAG